MLIDGSGPLIGAVIGAAGAALGYLAKASVESLRSWQLERDRRLARLLQLQALLRASRIAFEVQNDLARQLADRLQGRYQPHLDEGHGLEQMFVEAFDQFEPTEAELHSVIRAYTIHALRPTNQAISEWLRTDFEYRTLRGKTERGVQLSQLLNDLEAHLFLWLAKFEGWIPNQPTHALVYLADEKRHGLPFPEGVENVVDHAVRELLVRRRRVRWRKAS